MSIGPSRRGPRSSVVLRALLIAALPFVAGADPVRESNLVERVSRRLVQLDVTIIGPRELAATLEAADFEIDVGERLISALSADAACPAPSSTAEAPLAPLKTTTFLLYFDESHLTPDGRSRSIGLAREVLPPLLAGGGSAIVVSGSAVIKHYAGPTPDVAQVLDGLDRLEKDAAQVQTTARMEEPQTQEIVAELERIHVSTDPKPKDADDNPLNLPVETEVSGMLRRQKQVLLRRLRGFQDQETSNARRGIERLALALDRLAAAPRPRIAFYFGDTLRRNPGDHYYALLSTSPSGRTLFSKDGDDAFNVRSARNPFGVDLYYDQLVALAATRGVRLYTVQAQGLATSSDRVRDAQSTLVSMARETGGGAFLNGAPAGVIVDRVSADTACMYLLSFDGADLPEDRPLPVAVRVKRAGLKVSARGMLAVQSRDTRMRHERIAALYGMGARRSDLPLRAALIPLGYEKGKFSALLQIAARELPIPGGEWELGYSLVHDGEIEQEVTDRIRPTASGGALALEREIEIEPGEYALVGTAQEVATELMASDLRIQTWPDPKGQGAVLTPIAILQPTEGTFRRKKDVRASGNLALASDEPVRISAPTALVAVACRAPKEDRALRVERKIEGGDAIVGFPPIVLEPGGESCVQVRDLIPPGKLGVGYFRYEIVVWRDDEALARVDRVLQCRE